MWIRICVCVCVCVGQGRIGPLDPWVLPYHHPHFSVVSLASCGSDGTATYVIDTNGSPSFDLDLESYEVTLTSMSTLGNPMGATIRLGRDDSDDDYVNWVLAGNDTSRLGKLGLFQL